MNLWLITMYMGLCCVWCVPPVAPAPPNYIQPHPIPQHVLSPHHEHPATPLPYHTTPHQVSNANSTSFHNPGKMSRWALRQPWKRHSAEGGGGDSDTFFLTEIFRVLSSPYVTELTSRRRKKRQKPWGGGGGIAPLPPPDAAPDYKM